MFYILNVCIKYVASINLHYVAMPQKPSTSLAEKLHDYPNLHLITIL